MPKIITATLNHLSPVPTGSIYHSNGMFEFVIDEGPVNITTKFAEYDPVTNTYYKDKSIKANKLSSDDVVKEKEKTTSVIKVDTRS